MTADVATIPQLLLTSEQQEGYNQLKKTPTDATRFLAEALDLPEYKHDARSAITLDFAAAMLEQCHKLHLGSEQTAAVLSIGQQLLQGCADGRSREECQELLRSSLLQLCSAAPAVAAAAGSASSACLSPDAVSVLAASFTKGLLQHYSLYQLVFTRLQAHTQHQFHLPVESAVAPPALEQALPEADWQAHLAAEQAQAAAEAAAAEAAAAAAREAEEAALVAQRQAEEAAARQEQLQRKPQTLVEAVDKLVALRLEDIQQTLSAGYAAKAAALMSRVAQMEQQQQQQQVSQQTAPPHK
ncbi:hypothetical protein OEZ86_002663 [Tetradesmus obliquus]|nr:hypothetical protein OEZ86_002663 [Tetradesmus obliquus]